MASLKQTTATLAFLAAAYPRFRLTKETIKAYHIVLEDLPVEVLKAAGQHIAGQPGPWFPSAGDLRAAAFDLMEEDANKLTAGEAWAEALSRVNYYDPPSREEFSSPLAYDALEAIGGNRVLCMTMEETLHTARARFIQAYEALLSRERVDVRMLPQVREVAQRLAAGEERRRLGEG